MTVLGFLVFFIRGVCWAFLALMLILGVASALRLVGP